jgi:hypothetical protein
MLYKDNSDALQFLNAAYLPAWTTCDQRQMRPDPMPFQFYSDPVSGESRLYLLPVPIIMGERPMEQEEGGLKKYLSLFVEALKAVATMVGACMQ